MEGIEYSKDYGYDNHKCKDAHKYIVPKVEEILDELGEKGETSVFDLGCGNGSVAAKIHEMGYEVKGVDPSVEGIEKANNNFPNLDLYEGSAYDPLSSKYGKFDIVISLEVVEHIYYPRDYANTLFELTKEGGYAVISTPYHGYLKSLAIAIMGGWGKSHYSPLWRNGHIKIWCFKTLKELLKNSGFKHVKFYRVGRVPPLAKSMISVAYKSK